MSFEEFLIRFEQIDDESREDILYLIKECSQQVRGGTLEAILEIVENEPLEVVEVFKKNC